jgi:hypothetical protein
MYYLIIIQVMIMFNISNISFEEDVLLKKQNWKPESRLRLENLIAENAYQNKIVVLDFDNTIFSGDIGESVFQLMIEKNVINKNKLINSISPTFVSQGKNH